MIVFCCSIIQCINCLPLLLLLLAVPVQYQPGMYAIEMLGELPDDVIEHCENLGMPYKANKAAQKLK